MHEKQQEHHQPARFLVKFRNILEKFQVQFYYLKSMLDLYHWSLGIIITTKTTLADQI